MSSSKKGQGTISLSFSPSDFDNIRNSPQPPNEPLSGNSSNDKPLSGRGALETVFFPRGRWGKAYTTTKDNKSMSRKENVPATPLPLPQAAQKASRLAAILAQNTHAMTDAMNNITVSGPKVKKNKTASTAAITKKEQLLNKARNSATRHMSNLLSSFTHSRKLIKNYANRPPPAPLRPTLNSNKKLDVGSLFPSFPLILLPSLTATTLKDLTERSTILVLEFYLSSTSRSSEPIVTTDP